MGTRISDEHGREAFVRNLPSVYQFIVDPELWKLTMPALYLKSVYLFAQAQLYPLVSSQEDLTNSSMYMV